MTEIRILKQYNLEERTFEFARDVRCLVENFLKQLAILRMENKL
jgi:hypothetical protein